MIIVHTHCSFDTRAVWIIRTQKCSCEILMSPLVSRLHCCRSVQINVNIHHTLDWNSVVIVWKCAKNLFYMSCEFMHIWRIWLHYYRRFWGVPGFTNLGMLQIYSKLNLLANGNNIVSREEKLHPFYRKFFLWQARMNSGNPVTFATLMDFLVQNNKRKLPVGSSPTLCKTWRNC